MELKRSRDLLAAVRAAGGTWRKWTLVPPKQVLVLRSLIARGRARGKATTPRSLAWLMSPNLPKEIAWRVLACLLEPAPLASFDPSDGSGNDHALKALH